MVAPAAFGEGPRTGGSEENGGVRIHLFDQFVHTFRTQVTSIHHNFSAALAEKFGVSWRPTSEPVWLLGLRYEVPPECDSPQRGNAGAGGEEGGGRHVGLGARVRGAGGCGSAGAGPVGHRSAGAGIAQSTSASSSGGPSGAGAGGDASCGCGSPEDFAAAWAQIMRMTYRKGFAPMYRCVRSPVASSDGRRRYIRLTSDAGWGCMIRVGQMLLATALKKHQNPSAFGSGAAARPPSEARVVGSGATGGDGGQLAVLNSSAAGTACEAAALPLEAWFLDDPCAKRSPFSIFGFIRAAHGREVVVPPGEDEATVLGTATVVDGSAPLRQLTEKLPGDWFGPTTISETIAALVERSAELRDSLAVYVDADGILYEDEVRALAGVEEEAPAGSAYSPELAPSSAGKAKAVTAGRCSDSDDEFMVLSTASVSDASAMSPLNSTAPADLPQSLVASPLLTSEGGGEFEEARGAGSDVLQVGSFHELQPGVELSSIQLPPVAVGEGLQAADALSWDDGSSSATRLGSASSARPPPESRPAAEAPAAPRWDRAVLLLFPLQLGCEKYISEARTSAVLRYFELQTSLGAMGGRPRMAHFFVGRQGHGLLYVDPHIVQPAATSVVEGEAADGGSPAETFHNTPTVQVIPVEQIDSSISFAFYCRCEADLLDLLEGLKRIEATEVDAPIHVERTRPLALRQSQALRGTSLLWGDVDFMSRSFSEEPELEQEPQEAGPLPVWDGDAEEQSGHQEPDLEPTQQEADAQRAWGSIAEAVPSRPRCLVVGGGAVGDDCLLEFQREADECGGGGGDGIALGPSARMLCVGAPWADGPWAEVEEQGDILFEGGAEQL